MTTIGNFLYWNFMGKSDLKYVCMYVIRVAVAFATPELHVCE